MTTEAASRSVSVSSDSIEIAGATDRGTVRTENQDAWDARAIPGAGGDTQARDVSFALVVADGMGGHKGGREAAEAAVEAASECLAEPGPMSQRLEQAVYEANAAVSGIRDLIGGEPGTTLVLAILKDGGAEIANVGDSRAYLVRGGAAEQLTSDHSWVGAEVRAGRLTAAEARHHPRRNVITRAVMGDPIAAEIGRIDTRPGDTLVLCTDGVWEPLSDDDIAQLLSNGGPLVRDLERLCEAAIDAGGSDNVTAVAARLGEPGAAVR